MHKKDFLEAFEEFKSVRVISPKVRKVPRSFIDTASHTNKVGKSNNSNKVPASCNHSSSETTVGQRKSACQKIKWNKFPKFSNVSK